MYSLSLLEACTGRPSRVHSPLPVTPPATDSQRPPPETDGPSENPGGKEPQTGSAGSGGKDLRLAAIADIFNNPNYGPCTSCHSGGNWPFLDIAKPQGLERFVASSRENQHGVTTPGELVSLVVACVDQGAEDFCSGDKTTNEDNLDFKMPTKFGFERVAESDLETLRQWMGQMR
jgi:hypothetical protein